MPTFYLLLLKTVEERTTITSPAPASPSAGMAAPASPMSKDAIIDQLKAMVLEKENTLQLLKTKTKTFVDNMKAERLALEERLANQSREHANELAALREEVGRSISVSWS